MSRKQLSKSEIKKINEKLEKYNIELNKKDNIELVDDKLIFINQELKFFKDSDNVVPTLKHILCHESMLKTAIVDMGAIKFIINGADIMRPGVVNIDDGISKNDYIKVIDENNRKPICIGKAVSDSEDMKNAKSGVIIKNIHHVGDEIWNN